MKIIFAVPNVGGCCPILWTDQPGFMEEEISQIGNDVGDIMRLKTDDLKPGLYFWEGCTKEVGFVEEPDIQYIGDVRQANDYDLDNAFGGGKCDHVADF